MKNFTFINTASVYEFVNCRRRFILAILKEEQLEVQANRRDAQAWDE
jgi:hypothetical protein